MVASFEWIEPGKKKHDGLQGCEKPKKFAEAMIVG
jgi:hypothetical protein